MKEREAAIEIVKTLQKNGHQAVFAGGCVRDAIMNMPVNDIDIATDATPAQVEAIFTKTIPVGKQFGVIIVQANSFEFEVATFRNDIGSDGRRPGAVEFSSMEEDAKRRDLTINSIFLDPVTGELFDFVGGEEDIANKRIRFVGDPKKRIEEDFLRILRAVRFKSRFEDFSMEASASMAILMLKHKLKQNVSIERIKAELDKMLLTKKPSRAFETMRELKLLDVILPDLARLVGNKHSAKWHQEGDVWQHTMIVLDNTREMTDDLNTLWSALMHDFGKPATARDNGKGDISNHGHDDLGAELSDMILNRFKASNKDREEIVWLVAQHMRIKNAHKMRKAKLFRLVDHDSIEKLITLGTADSMASQAIDPALNTDKFAWKEFLMKIKEERGFKLPEPLLDGTKLIVLGFTPGPAFKNILEKVRSAQLDGKLTNRKEAEEFVKKNFSVE